MSELHCCFYCKKVSDYSALTGHNLLCSVDGCYCHDPSTVLAVLDPDMFTWQVRDVRHFVSTRRKPFCRH